MYAKKEIIYASRVNNVVKLTSLSADYNPGFLFSLFLAPVANQGVDAGDVLAVTAVLSESDGAAVEVPVVVGDWSPIVFRSLKSSGGIDLTKVKAYVAPIKDLEM